MGTGDDSLWQGGYKIPWQDPDFSRRMLAEHLTQDHDLASRRATWIDRQVAWIHGCMLGGTPASILDLGCGPGLYLHRLARLGHRGCGIDFGPAAVEYALANWPDQATCQFVLGDIRHIPFGGPYDLAMILYGEVNVFSPSEAAAILRKAQASLALQGCLIMEVHTPEAVERMGQHAPCEQRCESGLFSSHPYHCRMDSQWLVEQGVAVQTFTVTETVCQQPLVYRSTTKAWSDDALIALVRDAGFHDVRRCDDWPCNTSDLRLWAARR